MSTVSFLGDELFFIGGQISFAKCCCDNNCEGVCCPGVTVSKTVYITFSDFTIDSGHSCGGTFYPCVPTGSLTASISFIGSSVSLGGVTGFSMGDGWQTSLSIVCNTTTCVPAFRLTTIFKSFGCIIRITPYPSDVPMSGFVCDPTYWQGTVPIEYRIQSTNTFCGSGTMKITITE